MNVKNICKSFELLTFLNVAQYAKQKIAVKNKRIGKYLIMHPGSFKKIMKSKLSLKLSVAIMFG